jgi:hypothetical protein
MKMANWLSPEATTTYLQHIQSCRTSPLQQLGSQSGQPCTELSQESSSTPAPDISPIERLQILIAAKALEQQKAQTLAAQQVILPHRTYPGVSLTHDGVSWIAKANFDDGVALVGRGISPAAALNDFDEQWLGIK